jgi:hypothetical protein
MKAYVVTSPYVTFRAPNNLGQEVVTERYQGAPVPADANREDVERLLRKKMIGEADKPQPAAAPSERVPEDGPTKPTGNASKADWVEWAVANRADNVSEADARAEAEAATKADLAKRFADGS